MVATVMCKRRRLSRKGAARMSANLAAGQHQRDNNGLSETPVVKAVAA